MSEALRPCPFCGGEAEIRNEDVEPQGDPWYGKTMCLHVRCKTCGCAMFDETFHEGFYAENDAISAWNARATGKGD